MARRFSPDEIQFLKDNWKSMPDKELAEKLNRSIGTIRTKKNALGLLGKPGCRGRNWSKEDIDKLREYWGYKTVPNIARLLHRTATAVILKAKRLHLGAPTAAGEMLTANAAANLLGADNHTVTDRWIRKHELKATKKAFRGDRVMWMINIDDLLKWLEKNQGRWTSDRLEMYALGSEPEWLTQKRKHDRRRRKRTGYKWTTIEDQQAIHFFKKGYTKTKIAEEVGRTRAAVEHRLLRLDIWGSGKYMGRQDEKQSY